MLKQPHPKAGVPKARGGQGEKTKSETTLLSLREVSLCRTGLWTEDLEQTLTLSSPFPCIPTCLITQWLLQRPAQSFKVWLSLSICTHCWRTNSKAIWVSRIYWPLNVENHEEEIFASTPSAATEGSLCLLQNCHSPQNALFLFLYLHRHFFSLLKFRFILLYVCMNQ